MSHSETPTNSGEASEGVLNLLARLIASRPERSVTPEWVEETGYAGDVTALASVFAQRAVR